MFKPIRKFACGAMLVSGISMLVLPMSAMAQVAQKTEQPPKPEESEFIFLGPDGEPLPPEKQEELRRKYGGMLPKPQPKPLQNASTRDGGTGPGEITVSGQRPRGAVIGDTPPLQSYSPLEIHAYGSNNIGELLATLRANVSSDRGAPDSDPILLLNGRRITNVRQISKIPTEAIERLEIFPEELALSYGYRADQKVVNIVTFEKFRSNIGRLSFSLPTAGGQAASYADANILRIRKDTRITIDAGYLTSGSILESERAILPPILSPDERVFRTLVPSTRRLTLDGTVAGNWIPGVDSSFYGHFERTRLNSLLGLAPDPIEQSFRIEDNSLGVVLNGARRGWLWSFTANIEHQATQNATASIFQAEPREIIRSKRMRISADMLISGSPLSLPAGAVRTSFRFGAEHNALAGISAQSVRAMRSRLVREQSFAQMNLDVPLLGWKGEIRKAALSAMGNVILENTSNFGTHKSYGVGLNWAPSAQINSVVAFQNDEEIPTLDRMGEPLSNTDNGRIFDFSIGKFITIERIFGGNPNLLSINRKQFRFGLAIKPSSTKNLTLTLNYSKTRVINPVVSLAFRSTEAEAIFPDRFGRSPLGDLISVDSRPLNFRRSNQEIVRWGIDFTRNIGGLTENSDVKTLFFSDEDDIESRLPKGAIITRVQAGSEDAKPFEQANNRVFFTIAHTVRLRDTLLAPDGITKLDLLDGFAVGSRGGNARHSIHLQSGIFLYGIGAQLSATWNSGSFLRENATSTQASVNDLRFSDYLLINFGVNVDLGDKFSWARKSPFLRKARLSFAITNLLDHDVLVKDRLALVPAAYQPDYLDPIGRTVMLAIRARF